MMEILREVMEIEVAAKLRISHGDNLKFLSIIDPDEHREVEATISYSGENSLSINASLQAGSVTFFKFKGTFQKL